MKKKIIIRIMLCVVLLGLIGGTGYLIYSEYFSDGDYVIKYNSVESKMNGDPTGPVWLPRESSTKIEYMEQMAPELFKVERPSNRRIRFKLQWEKNFYHYDYVDHYEIQYATDEKFKNAKIKTIREGKSVKEGKRYIALRWLKKNKAYYIRVRGFMDYGEDAEDVHYTEWSETEKVEAKK